MEKISPSVFQQFIAQLNGDTSSAQYSGMGSNLDVGISDANPVGNLNGDPLKVSDAVFPVNGTDQFSNEANKFIQQQMLADNGVDLLPTNLETNILATGSPNSASSMTSTNLAKVASMLLGALGARHAGAKFPDVPSNGYAAKDYTPRILSGGAPAAAQGAQISTPFLLQNPVQPQFGVNNYLPVPSAGSSQVSVAKILQKG
jgi:hypothetical protein